MILSTARRRDEITRIAASGEGASVSGLAERFDVSESTIRRDLSALEAAGELTRTHGGAVATGAHAESTLRQRLGEFSDAKLAIGRRAAEEVEHGELLALDAGSTVAALAHELRGAPGVSVATTSVAVLGMLAKSEQTTLHMLGGTLRHVSQSFVGPLAEAALETFTFDRAFLGADSVDAVLGICEADPQQTRLKRLLAERADHVYVLAHRAKLGRRPFHAWARLPRPWTLVTDARPDETRPFEEANIDVISASSAS